MLVKLLVTNDIGYNVALFDDSFLGNCILSFTCRILSPRLTPNTSVTKYSCCFKFGMCYSQWSHFNNVSFCSSSQKTCPLLLRRHFPLHAQLPWVRFYSSGYILLYQKNGISVHLK